jgi:hypothetical protein
MPICEAQDVDPVVHRKWLEKHGFKPLGDGTFAVDGFEGKDPLPVDALLANIRANVRAGCVPLYTAAYDERVFVMVCGGPSLENHLDELREKALQPDKYMVVCSNMTADYLRNNGINPHVHFVLDPQPRKRFDVAHASPDTEYWINAASDPRVFETLKQQGITPYIFLADFTPGGEANKTVAESAPRGSGMMSIQGGTMAGLRAINLADARGFRRMEYYGFDATVQVKDGEVRNYAYKKDRPETVIEVTCEECGEKFDTTLIFQHQVGEFIQWSRDMPWMDIQIIGGGLIAHFQKHYHATKRPYGPRRYTEEYKSLQLALHSGGRYGHTGRQFIPTIYHAIAQLHKRLGSVSVLDYGSASGETMKAVAEHLFMPPNVESRCYDPFVEEFSAEPSPSDLVICTDVLEHVEPECTGAVLDHIQSLTKRLAFFSISLVKAEKTLADGRNAHINRPGEEFWLKEIRRRFITSEAKLINGSESLLVVAQAIDDVREVMRSGHVVPG